MAADLHPFHQLWISLALGLLVGIQREWALDRLAGVRTFSMISLLGTLSAILAERLGSWPYAIGGLGVLVSMVIGSVVFQQVKSPEEKSGLTTEIGMLLMYGIGALVHQGPTWLAASFAGALAFLLQYKIELQGIAKRLTRDELKAIMQFVLLSFVILPVLPDQVYGPYGVFNPHHAWLMVVLTVGVGLAGYIFYKFLGEKAGTFLGGVLGGLISSTATTLSYSRQTKTDAYTLTQNALVILLAWTVLYARQAVLILVSAPLFRAATVPLGVLFSVSTICILVSLRRTPRERTSLSVPQRNPTELQSALLFALAFSLILFASAFANEQFGQKGLMGVAIVSGLTELDAITLSISRLVQTGKIEVSAAIPVLIAAILSNAVVKVAIARVVGGRLLFRKVAPTFFATVVAGVALSVLWNRG